MVLLYILIGCVLALMLWGVSSRAEMEDWIGRIRPLLQDGTERSADQICILLGEPVPNLSVLSALEMMEDAGEVEARVDMYYLTPRIYYRKTHVFSLVRS